MIFKSKQQIGGIFIHWQIKSKSFHISEHVQRAVGYGDLCKYSSSAEPRRVLIVTQLEIRLVEELIQE